MREASNEWSNAANFFPTITSEDGAKHYKIKIDEANLFVRKMTVSDIVQTLLKTPAMYRYNEVISKVFLAAAGQQSWSRRTFSRKNPFVD